MAVTDEARRRREAEIAKGQQIGARVALMQRFDPAYIPNRDITPDERRRRDRYREQMQRNLEKANRGL